MANVVFYPFKLVWNALVIALLIWAFIGWWGLIFGSIVAIILLLIFDALDLLFLPLAILVMYRPFVPDDVSEEDGVFIHVAGLVWTGLLIFMVTMWITSL